RALARGDRLPRTRHPVRRGHPGHRRARRTARCAGRLEWPALTTGSERMTYAAPSMRAGLSVRRTTAALAQLGKVKLFEIWLGPLLAWSAVLGPGSGTPRT